MVFSLSNHLIYNVLPVSSRHVNFSAVNIFLKYLISYFVLFSDRRNNVLIELIEPGHLIPTEEQLLAYKVNLEGMCYRNIF